jgi:hypothetical protein
MAKAATKTRAAKAAASAKVRPAPTPKASAKTVAKPTVQMHDFTSGWTGESDGVNRRVSRTPIDASRFGSLMDAPLTERDQKNLAALRSQFAGRQFERGNLDAGILRRLGERGYIQHVSGGNNDANAVFKLTARKA